MLPAISQTELSKEDLLWKGLSFQVQTEEELAEQRVALGDRVHFYRGVWWREAKPSFSVPCFAYSRVDSRKSWPHPMRSLGGFTHLVEPGSMTNGQYPAIVYEKAESYSLSGVPRDHRKEVRKAFTHLEIRLIDRLNDLLVGGYEVYISWHQRARWGTNKCDKGIFERWIRQSFQHPKHLVLGAYFGKKLVGFMLPSATHHVASPAFVASHTDFLRLGPNYALFHAFLCIARQTPGVQIAEFGPLCAKSSLNNFKLKFGKLIKFPSYTHINPLIRPFVANWLRVRYPWLGL